jgi:hypothetical protein
LRNKEYGRRPVLRDTDPDYDPTVIGTPGLSARRFIEAATIQMFGSWEPGCSCCRVKSIDKRRFEGCIVLYEYDND